MLERPPKPATAKKRRQRLRARNGEVVLGITVIEAELAQALLRAGALTEAQALRRSELACAAGLVVKEWCARWLKP